MRKATDEELVSAYEELGNVWKVADRFGMCGQSVHERLMRLDVIRHQNLFTKEDERRLADEYVVFRDAGKLQELADSMGRTKYFLCRKARELGLTDQSAKRKYIAVWKYIPREVAEPIWDDFKRSRLGMQAYCKKHHYGQYEFSLAMQRHFLDEYETVVESKISKRTKYRVGRDFEYQTRDDLKRRGYLVVRTPASRSPTDLIAIKTGELIFVQCKLHGVMPPSEWNEFMDFAESVSATPVMANRRECGRGIEYHLLTDRKDGTRKPQPMRDFEPTEKTIGE